MTEPDVELSECIRCGVCEDVCPEVFVVADVGYIRILPMDSYPEDCVNEAIRNCPAGCIRWI